MVLRSQVNRMEGGRFPSSLQMTDYIDHRLHLEPLQSLCPIRLDFMGPSDCRPSSGLENHFGADLP